jgi:para-nitrobenzyl esterase
VVAAYERLLPRSSPAERLIAALTDSNFRIRSLVMADRRARQGAPTWMYSFAFETRAFEGRLKSPHAFDVPFAFDTIDTLSPIDRTPEARALGAAMSGTWAAFARTGVPEHPGVPFWPPYTLERRSTLVFNAASHLAHDPGAETRALWQRIAGAGP